MSINYRSMSVFKDQIDIKFPDRRTAGRTSKHFPCTNPASLSKSWRRKRLNKPLKKIFRLVSANVGPEFNRYHLPQFPF